MSGSPSGIARVLHIVGIVAVVAIALVVVDPGHRAHAAETDPYAAWLSPPKDGTAALNAAINDRLQRGLAMVNAAPRSSSLSCAQAARGMVLPLATTALSYSISDMRRWDVDHVPRDDHGADDGAVAVRWQTYRYAPLWPFGWLAPLDPAVRVGDVLFGTDKLGHFFTNGPRYLERYQEVIDAGGDVDAAEAAAVARGVGQENGWLGMGVCGVFSYADLEANWRGLLFFRGLCTSPSPSQSSSSDVATPRLVRRAGAWVLTPDFDVAAVVDPCWDEAWATSAYAAPEQAPIRRALVELCPRWRRDDIAVRWRRYAEIGCPARPAVLLDALRARGAVPDPRPLAIERVCWPPAPRP